MMLSRESMTASFELLVLAPNSWRGQWVNRQQLFSRMGRKHPVLYSTGGWFTWDRHSADWRQARWWGDIATCDDVWVDESPRFVMRAPKFRLLDEFALRVQSRRWTRFMRKLGKGPLVAYVFHPMFFPYVRSIGAEYLVYHAYDLYDHTSGWDRVLDENERELLKTADLVIAASDPIADALRTKVAREIQVLPNGADIAALSHALHASSPEPLDLAGIPHPRLGWVGSLHPQVDLGLIAELAARRPDWNFVLVGHVVSHADARADAERARCMTLKNVYFLGGKTVDDVPRYLVNMDVNLMFYRLSDQSWIKAGYPLKMHEYLAVGHPVVSTDLPTVRLFSEVVRIADGVEDWHAAIDEALKGQGRGTPERRKAVAAENGWDRRVLDLDAWLTDLVTAAPTRPPTG